MPEVLRNLLVLFAVAGVSVVVLQRLKMPAMLGLLATGLLLGRSGLGLIEMEQVELLAEVGVVVLLFTVGLEFSLSRLLRMWKVMAAVGLPQVGATAGIAAVIAWTSGIGPSQAIFFGMLAAMSSTAIVLKLLIDRGELSSPHGQIAAAVLLLQDLLVVVFMLALPILGQPAEHADGARTSPLWALGQGVAVVLGVLLAAKYVIPPIMFQVVRLQNREAFLLSLVVICIGTAAATASVGLSLALGAFLAGLALAESDYAHQMMSEVLPFRDTLSSLFFVSIGMMLDLGFAFAHPFLVASLTAALIVIKFFAGALPTIAIGYPLRIAILAGAGLAQVGEFSFLLAERGREEYGLMTDEQFNAFLAASVLTMALTPFLMAAARGSGDRLTESALRRRWRWVEGRQALAVASGAEVRADGDVSHSLSDHVIIVGYGIGGFQLARLLKDLAIPYVILEMNPERVRGARAQGEPIHYGDCASAVIMEHLGVRQARLLAILISDAASARRCVKMTKRMNPSLHIVIRTRYLGEIEDLEKLGADEIIPEEFVASVEIFDRVMRKYQVPRTQALDLIDLIRHDQYEVLRDEHSAGLALKREIVNRFDVELHLLPETSPAIGKTLADLRLRTLTGATVVAVRRGGRFLPNPDVDFAFQVGDIPILMGDLDQIRQAIRLLDPASGESPAKE